MWQPVPERTPLQVFCDVTCALIYRECKTRFGDRRYGVLWLLMEPLFFIVVISVMLSFRGREALGLSELPVYIATGVVPLLMFRKGVGRCIKAAPSNRGLFVFPLVRPFSSICARWAVEVLVALTLLAVLTMAFLWLRYQAFPVDALGVLTVLMVLAMLTLGVALIVASLYIYLPSIASVWGVLSMPLLILSGAIIPVLVVVPPQYHDYLLLNPILHALELLRIYWLSVYPVLIDVKTSWLYLLSVTLGSMTIGLALYRVTWRKMVSV
ncbi:ABC transporter permease [Vibrio sp. PNB22_3_1]